MISGRYIFDSDNQYHSGFGDMWDGAGYGSILGREGEANGYETAARRILRQGSG